MSQPEDQIDGKETKQQDPQLPSSKPSYGREIHQSSIETLGNHQTNPGATDFSKTNKCSSRTKGSKTETKLHSNYCEVTAD
jgi:hypothetical protein